MIGKIPSAIVARIYMKSEFILWIDAIRSGFADSGAWQQWAERSINELPFAPPWLAALLDEETPEGAIDAFTAGAGEYRGPWDGPDDFHFKLGFLWLEYDGGRNSLCETLIAAGKIADCRNSSDPGCEEFFLLANEIDGGGPVIPGPHRGTLEERASKLFAPSVAITVSTCQRTGIPIRR